MLAGVVAFGADTDSKNPTVEGAKDQAAQSAVRDKQAATPNRTKPFFKEWKMDDLLPAVVNPVGERDFKQGSEVFSKAICGACHALGRISQGNGFCPELTGVGSKSRPRAWPRTGDSPATMNPKFTNPKTQN